MKVYVHSLKQKHVKHASEKFVLIKGNNIISTEEDVVLDNILEGFNVTISTNETVVLNSRKEAEEYINKYC